MNQKINNLIKKTYKPLIAVILALAFFFVYNTYLVDRSVVSLQAALAQVSEVKTVAEFEKIKPLLKMVLLKEIAKSSTSGKNLAALELAQNIAASATSLDQIKDIKNYLESVIKDKQLERGAVLATLDNLIGRIFAPSAKVASKADLESQAAALTAKINSTSNKDALQVLYFDLANIYVQMPGIQKAEGAFLKTIELDPKTPLAMKARFNLAWAYKEAGQFDKAVKAFKELSADPLAAELSITSKLEIADTMFKKGDYKAAADLYGQVAGEHPDFSLADLALFEAGYISYYSLDNKEVALKYFDKIKNKGLIKEELTNVKASLAKEFRNKGFRLLRNQDYPQAIVNFNKAVEINPGDSRSYSGLGLAYYWLNDNERARNFAKKAAAMNKDDESAIINSMFVLINTNNLNDALQIGEGWLGKNRIMKPEFYYNLGNAYLMKFQMDKAIRMFETAVSLNPDFYFVYNNLGCALWSIGDYTAAIKRFKDAIARDPQYADAHFNLGIAYFNLKQNESARDEFKIVLDIRPKDNEAEKNLRRAEKALQYKPQ